MSSKRLLKVSRLEGLTDGIFAIAMTILVLDVHLPAAAERSAIFFILQTDIFLKLFIYAGSFIILGTLWIAMNFQLGLLDHVNRPYLWANVFYLMVICVVPFSASLLGAYPTSPASLTFYAVNLLCASVGQLLTARSAHVYHLNKPIYNIAIRNAVVKRIFIAPGFWLAAIFLAHWNSIIAFMALVAPTLIYMLPGAIDKYDGIEEES